MKVILCFILVATILLSNAEEEGSGNVPFAQSNDDGEGSGDVPFIKELVVVKCLRGESKKCVIPSIEDPLQNVALPDLKDKTALQIKSGKVRVFTEPFCRRLVSIVKLQLGSLKVEELFLSPTLEEVDVGGNLVSKVLFKEGADYRTEILDMRNNRLTSLKGFGVLENLQELRLDSNLLETVDMSVFQSMTKLKRLNLGNNKITTVLTPSSTKLLELEYFKLAGNSINKLDVHNWEFESLTELDLSSNNLVHVESLKEKLPSLQQISMANNGWHCAWLDDVLKFFEKSFVIIKDSDKECEGLSPSNICCVAEFEANTYEESFTKLDTLEKNQKKLQPELEQKLREFETAQSRKISEIRGMLEKLLGTQASYALLAPAGDDLNKSQFTAIKDKVANIKATLEEELKRFEKQKEDNAKIQRKLGFTIVELKRALERETKKVAELQAQFSLLKDHVRSKLEKYSRLSN
uniref:Putative leucine-rich repeat protein n=1 Tax=Culex tarsalis TaxID=7177 RepID=A0A1Q3EWT7_CULTA